MVLSKVKAVPLVCPDCSKFLGGLAYDNIFFCVNCQQGLSAGERGWKKHPLFAAAPESEGARIDFYLPLWEIAIAARAKASNPRQEQALTALGEFERVWVTAFAAFKPSYFGDLGLRFTERKIVPKRQEALAPGRFVAGCSRKLEEALAYVELFLAAIIDRKADVTGLELAVKAKSVNIWAIPFSEAGDKIVDLVSGAVLPSFTLEDLEEIKRINKQLV